MSDEQTAPENLPPPTVDITAGQPLPSEGRIVRVRDLSLAYNGKNDHPAIVTGIVTQRSAYHINATMFPDLSGIKLMSALPMIDPQKDGDSGWYWPPRT